MNFHNKIYILLIAIVFAAVCFSAKAQVFKKTTMQTGESISSRSSYLYPAFTEATVKLKNGGTLQLQMNFNLLICQMQFISSARDTLNIAKPEDVDSILLNGNTFFYNENYYEVLASANSSKLIVSRKVTYEPIKIGALGLPDRNGSGVQSYTSIITVIGERTLVMNEDVEITQETDYFISHVNNELTKANKAGFLKVFPKSSPHIQNYLKEHKTNFNNETDLEKLFAFCTSLH